MRIEAGLRRRRVVIALLCVVLAPLLCLAAFIVVSRPSRVPAAPDPRGRLSPVHAGPGCTTAYYIDKDCDGYGVGKKAGGEYPLYPAGIAYKLGDPANWSLGDLPDADDEDPAVRTPEEWRAKWGNGNHGIVRFLAERKQFSNSSRVWYVAGNGNDAGGVLNDPERPFATPAAALRTLSDLRGGVIVVRGGNWGDGLDFNPCGYAGPCVNLSGTPAAPVYVLAYPGERVVLTKPITADINYAPKKAVSSVTFDGLILSAAKYGLGDGVSMADTDHMTFVNCEFAGWHQLIWSVHTEDVLIKWSVFHDMMYHAIYFASCCRQVVEGAGDLDFSRDAARYAAQASVGASYRGRIIQNVMYNNGESGYNPIHINTYTIDNVVEGNIISFSGGTAIGLQSGVYRASVRNNVIVYPGACGITLSLYGPEAQAATLRWNVIENNTIYAGSKQYKIRNGSPGCGILLTDYSKAAGRWIRDTVIRNNIIAVDNSHPRWGEPAIAFRRNSYPGTTTVEGNLISTIRPPSAGRSRATLAILEDAVRAVRTLVLSVTDATVMTVAADASPEGARGGSYDFAAFQAFGFRNNSYADPAFAHADAGQALSPGVFDLSLKGSSPARDAGSPDGAPQTDARGNPRLGRPDIGAYEYVERK
jgi:hypothetical protein